MAGEQFGDFQLNINDAISGKILLSPISAGKHQVTKLNRIIGWTIPTLPKHDPLMSERRCKVHDQSSGAAVCTACLFCFFQDRGSLSADTFHPKQWNSVKIQRAKNIQERNLPNSNQSIPLYLITPCFPIHTGLFGYKYTQSSLSWGVCVLLTQGVPTVGSNAS